MGNVLFLEYGRPETFASLPLGNVRLHGVEAHHDLVSTRNIEVKLFRHVRQILQRHM